MAEGINESPTPTEAQVIEAPDATSAKEQLQEDMTSKGLEPADPIPHVTPTV